MTFLDFVFAGQNYFFVICLGIALGLIVLEVISALMGGVIDSLADSLVPESLTDVDIDPATGGEFTGFFQWMLLGRVPIIIWLMVFLMGWGLTGLIMQAVLFSFTGWLLFAWLAIPVALVQNLFVVRGVVLLLSKILPKDETYVTSERDFIGQKAVIFLKPIAPDLPSLAKFKDLHGTEQQVAVEFKSDQNILEGQEVVLHEQLPNGNFQVISIEEFNSIYLK